MPIICTLEERQLGVMSRNVARATSRHQPPLTRLLSRTAARFHSHVAPHCRHTTPFPHKIRTFGLTTVGEKPAALQAAAGVYFQSTCLLLGDSFIWVRRIHVCVRAAGRPNSPTECQMMSCVVSSSHIFHCATCQAVSGIQQPICFSWRRDGENMGIKYWLEADVALWKGLSLAFIKSGLFSTDGIICTTHKSALNK